MATFKYDVLPDWFVAVVEWVHLRQSDDLAKIDLEVVCQECGQHLCDADNDDSLACLIRVALDHAASCTRQLGVPYGAREAAEPGGEDR